MPKNFHCSGCGGQHKRPVGVKCQFKDDVNMENSISDSMGSATNTNTNSTDTVNHDILSALTSVSSRLTAIEQRIQQTEDKLQNGVESSSDGVNSPTSMSSHRSTRLDSDDEDEVVTLTTTFLKSSRGIQHAVDRRLQELASLSERGMFKSQRGGNEQVTVPNKIPWPQNHILAGTSKSRVTYDNLSTFQWVSGFCAIIKDEKNAKTKNQMLEYMSDLMEDAQDFGWSSAKGAHAALLCRMEEGKVNWNMTEKIDRIRRAHAQKVINVPTKKPSVDLPGVPCKFFQSQKCPHKSDHHTAGQFYRHICSFCNTLGKRFHHPLKECRNSKRNPTDSKNE